MIKYILRPGFVRSQADGDRHYVGAATLARLYGVPMRECLVVHEASELRTYFFNDAERDAKLLYPRFDGNYGRSGRSRVL